MLEPSVNKVQDIRAYNSIKKRIQHRRFPVCLEKSIQEKNSGRGVVGVYQKMFANLVS